MFGRQERMALVLLCVVLVAVISAHLVLTHLGKSPFASPYSERSEDGALVIVNGTIADISLTKTGGHVILQVDNVSVFIQNDIAGSINLSRGARISAIGVVQTYRGKKEIVVQSVSDVLDGS
jgi:DNA/RNA endonuclease YhcR with UshA esterase domain